MPAGLYIAIFGVCGVMLRYGIDLLLAEQNRSFPVSTMLINILGCAVAAIIYVLSEKFLWPSHWQQGLLIGFCGGFTTFSAFALQTVNLWEKERFFQALAYVTLSPVVSLMLMTLTIFCLRRFL